MITSVDLTAVYDFLPCKTPNAWIQAALVNQHIMLIDHANCEKKAAATALSLMHWYTGNTVLLNKMSKLAREELRHFEQVLKIMTRRGIDYNRVTASRYASGLRSLVRKMDPARLVDTLLVGALIEARSCERFAVLVPFLDEELAGFYTSLLQSESRHFTEYLTLARQVSSEEEMTERLGVFKAKEESLILSVDDEFRFHSGPPAAVKL